MRLSLSVLLALSFAAAADEVVVTIPNPVSPEKWEPNITALDSQSADSVTITCEEPLDLSQEKGGALEIIGARDFFWKEDVVVGSVTADIELHSGATQVHVRGVENMAMKEDADIDVRITSNGMPYSCGSTAAYLFDDGAGDIRMHSATLSLAYAHLTPYGSDKVATVVGSPYPFFGTWVDSLSVDKIGLNLRSVVMNGKPVTPLIIEGGVGIGKMNIGSIDISLERGNYDTVYVDGVYDSFADVTIGSCTVTLNHQAHVSTLESTTANSVNVVMNGGALERSAVTIEQADIIGGVNQLIPFVEHLTIDGDIILQRFVAAEAFEIKEGSHIDAIGMAMENGYAEVKAGTAFTLVNGAKVQEELAGVSASYGDVAGTLSYTDDNRLIVTFDEDAAGDTYYVVNETDIDSVQQGLKSADDRITLLNELRVNTSVGLSDIIVTDAGALVFDQAQLPAPSEMEGQLTLLDGAQLIFDITPSALVADTPLFRYEGAPIDHSGTTLIQLIVHENWDPADRSHFTLATGLASLGDNVRISVTPSDRDSIIYLGQAILADGTLFYGFVPEPATTTLSLFALTALLSRRRRGQWRDDNNDR